jgi:hypothetical protein
LDRRERPTATNIKVWQAAIVESDWNEPWIIRTSQAQLVDCE